jgi:hypothetical protein
MPSSCVNYPNQPPVEIFALTDFSGGNRGMLELNHQVLGRAYIGPVWRNDHLSAIRGEKLLHGLMPFGLWLRPMIAVGKALVRPVPNLDFAALRYDNLMAKRTLTADSW